MSGRERLRGAVLLRGHRCRVPARFTPAASYSGAILGNADTRVGVTVLGGFSPLQSSCWSAHCTRTFLLAQLISSCSRITVLPLAGPSLFLAHRLCFSASTAPAAGRQLTPSALHKRSVPAPSRQRARPCPLCGRAAPGPAAGVGGCSSMVAGLREAVVRHRKTKEGPGLLTWLELGESGLRKCRSSWRERLQCSEFLLPFIS